MNVATREKRFISVAKRRAAKRRHLGTYLGIAMLLCVVGIAYAQPGLRRLVTQTTRTPITRETKALVPAPHTMSRSEAVTRLKRRGQRMAENRKAHVQKLKPDAAGVLRPGRENQLAQSVEDQTSDR